MPIPAVLLVLTILLALHDLRRRTVPNWTSLPLLAAGLIAHAPGTASLDAASALLVLSWFATRGGIGAGDLKLQLAVLWCLPPALENTAAITLFTALVLTAAVQLLIRRHREGICSGNRPAPAAWRSAAFLALLNLALMAAPAHV